MHRHFFILILIFLVTTVFTYGQQIITGKVINEEEEPLTGVSVGFRGAPGGTSTDKNGTFQIQRPLIDSLVLVFSHVAYKKIEIQLSDIFGPLEVVMEPNIRLLGEVEVAGENVRNEGGMVTINKIDFSGMPSPGYDFNNILKTIPGVVSNSELSSAYSVRGGNLDENLVLVNGIPVYRPFLISNGRQEGLSFIVPDFVANTSFYTGGWQPKFGNKLSSVLDVRYKRPDTLTFQGEIGLLGWNVNGGYGNEKLAYLISARKKNTQYLLNSLETEGQYLPNFTDFQSLLTWNPNTNTEIQWLYSYAKNRYLVLPESRVTDFGTFNRSMRLFVAFEGREIMNYNTYQSALSIQHKPRENWELKFTFSGVKSAEEEYKNVEGGYRICDVNRDPDSPDFNNCLIIRGVGTNFNYSRNDLYLDIYDARFQSIHLNEDKNLEWGVQFNANSIDHNLYEYTFVDSADYITQLEKYNSDNQLSHQTTSIYFQREHNLSQREFLRYGVRTSYITITDEWTFEPRIQYIKPVYDFINILNLRWSAGVHYQPPVFREFLSRSGELDSDINSQAGAHTTMGFDYFLDMWDRPFNWTGEFFGKYFWNVIPYDIDNVRIRYLDYPAKAYAYGFDTRFGGEFIPEAESWFSLSLLSTREKLEGINNKYVRRPSDQRLTFGLYFQDYFVDNPDMRVSVHYQFGSGLPFGPPERVDNRSIYNGKAYNRLDIGFIRLFRFENFRARLTAEILNVFAAENPITYNWIQDFNSQFIAVPNNLSARFFNLKAGIKL